MNNLHRYTRYPLRLLMAVLLFGPALALAHGAVDFPISRQMKCVEVGGVWSNEDGSGISDLGCRAAAMSKPTQNERGYPLSQWHEFSANVEGYQDDENVKKVVTDGTLCAGGDLRKSGFDVVSPHWYETDVTPKDGKITMRMVGTQPHVPSYFKIYLTKPGYQATAPLRWEDLVLVLRQDVTAYRTDWAASAAPKPSTEPAVNGFFELEVPIPNGQVGRAILYVVWQREDRGLEGFYNCSDIHIGGGQTIPFPWFEKGQFIKNEIQPKVGQSVRFRVFGHTNTFSEIVDLSLPITAANQASSVWGKQLADQLSRSANIIRVGVRSGSEVIFDNNNIHNNLVYLADDKNGVNLSITGDGGVIEPPVPVNPNPPQAVIQGPTTVKSGQRIILSGKTSVGHNGPLTYHWIAQSPLLGENYTTDTLTVVAPTVDQTIQKTVRLTVYDLQNETLSTEQINVTVTAADTGEHPAYVPGNSYKEGDIVSHDSKNYKCKPFPAAGWCSQSPAHYAPGTGSNWRDAWDEY